MKLVSRTALFISVLSGSVAPAQAHHAWPVDMDKLITVQGTVTDFMWANPHPMISLTVATADGGTEEWQIGGPAINRMESRGWTKDTVKAGDTITGVGYQFRDGQKVIRLEKITFADGTEIQVYAR